MPAYATAVKRPVRTLTETEVLRLLSVSGSHKDGFRDHVLMSLALSTGLREHEIVALNVGDVRGGARCARHVALRVFKRSSKEASHQEIILSDGMRAKLDKLLKLRERAGEVLAPDAPLFLSRLGRRLSTRQVRRAFALWQERAGFERRFNFHCLRHTACSGVYRRTKDIRLTQRFARHASIESTMIYTHSSDEDLLRVVQELPC
jgi:site-specific recombinase XerC